MCLHLTFHFLKLLVKGMDRNPEMTDWTPGGIQFASSHSIGIEFSNSSVPVTGSGKRSRYSRVLIFTDEDLDISVEEPIRGMFSITTDELELS
ncbi:hypothetical protein TCAL_16521 [Tigriopus californicus]|uniref:Uncharacterized protein n=1 Tax=Tigriopus californicus TaxID=6832 RepID=A0A553NV03_TIGCA|nr:hypothetical protein TCAL_16521 [Tigriopus californicus]